MFFSLFRDKRGVSEVVASLVMILVVSIAGTVIYSYCVNVFSSSWSSLQLRTNRKEEQVQERFSIIAVWWDNDEQLNLTILNYGKIELAIDAIYINGEAVTSHIVGRGETVGIGSIVSMRFNSPIAILDDQTYQITVVSERGSKNVVYWKA